MSDTSTDSLSDRSYHYIQKKLLSGEWSAGDVLSELAVAREMGISRTPVREAFRMLEQEGVLEQVPRFGTRVKALDRRDLVELYELREALEPYAVSQAAGKLTDADAHMLDTLCREMKAVAEDLRKKGKTVPDAPMMKRLLSADLAFHQLLIRAAGNRRMMKIVADSRLLARIFATPRQEHHVGVVEETYRYHIQILEAVNAGKGELARKLMAEHIRASLKEALEHYDQQRAEAEANAMPLDLPDDMMSEFQRMERNARPRKSQKTRAA
jgi:DNA-binding GntR family transcriptional regulator